MLLAVHIYLCDDAPKDHKEEFKGESYLAVTLRQQLAEQLYKIHGIPVIRVDRDKGKNESNPKSANLNSCLKKIYGENATPPEMEVVAVFDADQAAHSNFFTSTLPWMDAGDDVAVVQSPQVCSFLLHACWALNAFMSRDMMSAQLSRISQRAPWGKSVVGWVGGRFQSSSDITRTWSLAASASVMWPHHLLACLPPLLVILWCPTCKSYV